MKTYFHHTCFILIVLVACVVCSGCCHDGMPNTDTHNKIKTIKVNHAQYLLGILNKQYGGVGLTKPKKDFTCEEYRDIANHILAGNYNPEDYFAKSDEAQKIQLLEEEYTTEEEGILFQISISYTCPLSVTSGGTVYTDPFYMILAAYNFKHSGKLYMLPYARSYRDMCDGRRKIIDAFLSDRYDIPTFFAESDFVLDIKMPAFQIVSAHIGKLKKSVLGKGFTSLDVLFPGEDRYAIFSVYLFQPKK